MNTDRLLRICNARFYDDGQSLRVKAPYKNSPPVGSLAGWVGTRGYRRTKILGKHYNAHALLILMRTGSLPLRPVDHINGDVADNRDTNLRVVPQSENAKNRRISTNNTSGVSGVYFNKAEGKWKAQIGGARRRYLGSFATLHEAISARREAEAQEGYIDRAVVALGEAG